MLGTVHEQSKAAKGSNGAEAAKRQQKGAPGSHEASRTSWRCPGEARRDPFGQAEGVRPVSYRILPTHVSRAPARGTDRNITRIARSADFAARSKLGSSRMPTAWAVR